MDNVKLISVNVSEIKTIVWKGKKITTGIYKYPVLGKRKVRGVNIQGDDQADRKVHGGIYKAIYGYPFEHYEYWEKIFPDQKFHKGMFGENLTTEGIIEDNLYIGDLLHIGSTTLKVVQPRLPCFKLGIKFGTQKIIKLFVEALKPGFYCRIEKEGELEVGDTIQIERNPNPLVSIVDIVKLIRNQASRLVIKNATQETSLPPSIQQRAKDILNGMKTY